MPLVFGKTLNKVDKKFVVKKSLIQYIKNMNTTQKDPNKQN